MNHTAPGIKRVWVVAALEDELAAVPGHRRLTITKHRLGVGGPRAAARMRDAYQGMIRPGSGQARPDLLIIVGFSGGLNDRYPTGATVEPIGVFGPPHEAFRLQQQRIVTALPESLPPTEPLLVSVTSVVHQPRDKRDLGHMTGASLVDMETFWLLKIAYELDLPCRVIRAVSDEADHPLPAGVEHLVRPDGRREPWAIAKHLLRRPASIPSLIRLGRAASKAQRGLRTKMQQVWAELSPGSSLGTRQEVKR